MGLYARDKGDGQSFDPVKQGMHQGVSVGVFDLGTHDNPTFNKSIHQVLLTWELPNERITIEKEGEPSEEKPRLISKFYTLSLHEKSNLRKDLESWRGKAFTAQELEGFDLGKLLGVNCSLQVIHKTKKDKTFAQITTVLPLMGESKKEPETSLMFFSFEESGNIPGGTPDWITDIIKQSDEWKRQLSGEINQPEYDEMNPPPVEEDDSIPF